MSNPVSQASVDQCANKHADESGQKHERNEYVHVCHVALDDGGDREHDHCERSDAGSGHDDNADDEPGKPSGKSISSFHFVFPPVVFF